MQPSASSWSPSEEYDQMEIGSIDIGPRYVTFKGRIVHIYDQPRVSNKANGMVKPLESKGCLKLIVADDTGAVTVRLWYAQVRYNPHLGQVVTVWTVHISHGTKSYLTSRPAPYFTSIFPERERCCHIIFHESTEDDGNCYRHPYGCSGTELVPGLMTLREFTNGGYDVEEAKLLVCVKSIGARTTRGSRGKSGRSYEMINIRVFDDTAEAVLTLYDIVCHSASNWQPSHTILLISEPKWSIDNIAKLSVNANTRIDVNPHMADAQWLRAMAQRLTKREHVNPPFPVGVFDVEAVETAPVRMLYTLAEIDEFARGNPKERFMGYISVVLTELKFVINFKRNMLMSTECCGNPIYANSLTAQCTRCEKQVPLRINPRIIGPVIDETGQVASGKLIFSDEAWRQLLGRTPAQLLRDDVQVLSFMEQRMLFLRVTMGFAWCADGTAPGPAEGERVTLPFERKRKRLDVFGEAATGKGKGKGKEKEKGKSDEKEDAKTRPGGQKEKSEEMTGGVGEVGRLCIWCVKM
ncbi:uncharacterized protein EI97DRAFT_398063 [Westerdykella ornata]|uniref:Nucleic acid-binding protein n=1 Tax=Westerdykella ornata TaxID=318751 RepID=A0A6A6JIH1_WESOR|nr:uncharacterized protein EI97DRAFT_398063 [Westerdykella ornata]KAF2276361.1 hypothetical protein EI97DRAFT_398063 [Westerdykella ornata]